MEVGTADGAWVGVPMVGISVGFEDNGGFVWFWDTSAGASVGSVVGGLRLGVTDCQMHM